MTVNSSRKHLVLVGAGRANLHVLKGLARQGSGDMNVTLVAPQPYYIDPAMLPGYVAGDYALDEVVYVGFDEHMVTDVIRGLFDHYKVQTKRHNDVTNMRAWLDAQGLSYTAVPVRGTRTAFKSRADVQAACQLLVNQQFQVGGVAAQHGRLKGV